MVLNFQSIPSLFALPAMKANASHLLSELKPAVICNNLAYHKIQGSLLDSAAVSERLLNIDRQAIVQTGAYIREGFAKGDTAMVKAYHHPQVVKAIFYDKTLNGRDAFIQDLAGTLKNNTLVFQNNQIKSILIKGDIAIEQTLFEIKGTPKSGGESWVFKGRTILIYVRYPQSPTGWAIIQEVIQAANK